MTGAVVARLANVATKASRLTDSLVDRLRKVESLIDEQFVDDLVVSVAEANPSASEMLQPGARVCFTGTATSTSGRMYERDAMERLARDAALSPSRTSRRRSATSSSSPRSGRSRARPARPASTASR